ncbi:hypothetical protein PVIIG_05691 [Plasmodium vivax India VII]|uniref:Variable surface protein Vir7-like protein n=1 Tax=Plasmodium vivax India VII TaxID=1077284 RepID=A0A0J9S294_PLAVI|nr:hypothetical protein PVIIG_05691 [Plasmodium vivax India VII]
MLYIKIIYFFIFLYILYIQFLYFFSQQNNIDKLTSKIMYTKFEDGQGGCEYFPFYLSINEELQRYKMYNLHRMSDKILKALCDIIYPKVKSQAVFSTIINMIYSELYSNIAENFIVCKNVYTPIDEDRFNKNKLLFDYSKDYHNIEIDTSHGKTTCDKTYKEYITKYIDIYNDAYLNCTGSSEKKNYECDKYSEMWSDKLHSKLSTFSCRYSENDRAVLDKAEAYEQQQTVPVQTYIHASATLPSSRQIAAQNENLGMPHYQRGQTFPGSFATIQSDDATESGTSKTTAGSVAPVLGVSSISLLLYKVTPLGGFIRNFLGRNRNMHNPVEYMDSFNPYSDGMVPGDRTMNISYNRL